MSHSAKTLVLRPRFAAGIHMAAIAVGIFSLVMPAAQAQTKTVTLLPIATGNWTDTGVHTRGSYVTGLRGGVQSIGYYVFDLTPVKGTKLTVLELVLPQPVNGCQIHNPNPNGKPGARISVRGFRATQSLTELMTGNVDPGVFHNVANFNNDFDYEYLQNCGSKTFELAGDDNRTTLQNALNAGGLFAIATNAIFAGATGDFAFSGTNGSGVQLRVTF